MEDSGRLVKSTATTKRSAIKKPAGKKTAGKKTKENGKAMDEYVSNDNHGVFLYLLSYTSNILTLCRWQ
jgi:hypothetical protein